MIIDIIIIIIIIISTAGPNYTYNSSTEKEWSKSGYGNNDNGRYSR